MRFPLLQDVSFQHRSWISLKTVGGDANSSLIHRAHGCDTDEVEAICPICEGAGMRVLERADGVRVAEPCVCRAAKKAEKLIAAARIPKRYESCTLEDFDMGFSSVHASQVKAFLLIQEFAAKYPEETKGKGLLLEGAPGLGKTHLAVGLLRRLMNEKKAQGLFVDYRDLLKQVQNSYNPSVAMTELSVLQPVFDAEVLVIDDLGASKPSDWVFDTVAHVLNSRYNDNLTTIITTNFQDRPETPPTELARKNEAQRIMTERTLGDRISNRVLSRLHEMCVVVTMQGKDFREIVRKAHM